MSLSKAKNRERMRRQRIKDGSNRLHVQLNITPEMADFLEQKAGNKTIERYLLAQIEKAIGLEVQPNRASITRPLYDPTIHKAGDQVVVLKGKKLIETMVPLLDGDGYPVYGD